jgi:signal transduction histidine kinase
MNPPLRERLRWAGQEPTPADASADRAVMARSFVYLYGAGAALSFATLFLPHASDRWAPGIALIGGAAAVVALVTLIGFDRLPIGVFYALPALGTVHIALITYWGGPGSMAAYAMFFTWVVLSSCYFLSRRLAVLNLVFVVVAYALVLTLGRGLEAPALHWVMLSGTMVVGGLLIGFLRDTVATTLRRLEATTEIALAISGESSLGDVLDLIAVRGRSLGEARTVAILLAEGDDLRVAAAAGAWSERLRDRRVPRDGSVAGRALRSRRAERVVVSRGEPLLSALELDVPAQSAMVVPLVFRGQAYGLLVAFDRLRSAHGFTAADERLALSFAASAATAVGNAQSVEEDRLRQRIAAGEDERRRWARDLHDSTLQGLGGLRVLLSSALQRRGTDGLDAAVQDSVGHLGSEIENLHSIIADMRPPALDTLGLGPALEGLGEATQRLHGVEVECVVAIGPARRDASGLGVETTVFRVAQEALANTAKHSGASRVRLEASAAAGQLRLVVEDDGVGFEAERPRAGFGLRGMRERVALAGGRLEIASASGRGTVVRAFLPWREVREERCAARGADVVLSELALERAEGPVVRLADGALAATDDLGDLARREVQDVSEHDHLPLELGQVVNERD